MSDTKLTIGWGRRTFPDDVRAVWGARLIWPNDLVYNRQDLDARDEEARSELIAWINGPNAGDGAINEMQKVLGDIDRRFAIGLIDGTSEEEVVIYEDDIGKIVGSPQGSHGNLYVAAWLKAHEG